MILVRRDASLIPPRLMNAAIKAQEKLEAIVDIDERKEFIEKKSGLWRRFGKHLKQMSYGKCWYSESDCVQSFADVDHFRPKKAARRSETSSDDGYPWLAFSWENFRYAAQRSNQLNTDEETEEVVGKGSWFPLMPESKCATWDDRCIDDERPVLIDPTKQDDIRLVHIDGAGALIPSDLCMGQYERQRVTESVKYLGLNLDGLVGARKRAMDAVLEQIQEMLRVKAAADKAVDGGQQFAEMLPIGAQLKSIQLKTHPKQPYAAATRAQLVLMGLGAHCLRVEEMDLP